MRIIIAPAKKMNTDLDNFPPDALPQFLDRTERLMSALQAMSPKELQALWKCNEAIARLNVERLRDMNLRCRLTPAVLPTRASSTAIWPPACLRPASLPTYGNTCASCPAFTDCSGPLTA